MNTRPCALTTSTSAPGKSRERLPPPPKRSSTSGRSPEASAAPSAKISFAMPVTAATSARFMGWFTWVKPPWA